MASMCCRVPSLQRSLLLLFGSLWSKLVESDVVVVLEYLGVTASLVGICLADRINASGGGSLHRYWSLAADCGRLLGNRFMLSVKSNSVLFHSRPLHRLPSNRTRSTNRRNLPRCPSPTRNQLGQRLAISFQSTNKDDEKKHRTVTNFQAYTDVKATPAARKMLTNRIRMDTVQRNLWLGEKGFISSWMESELLCLSCCWNKNFWSSYNICGMSRWGRTLDMIIQAHLDNICSRYRFWGPKSGQKVSSEESSQSKLWWLDFSCRPRLRPATRSLLGWKSKFGFWFNSLVMEAPIGSSQSSSSFFVLLLVRLLRFRLECLELLSLEPLSNDELVDPCVVAVIWLLLLVPLSKEIDEETKDIVTSDLMGMLWNIL